MSSAVHPPDERSFRILVRPLNKDSDHDRNPYSIRAGTPIHIRPEPLFTSPERLFTSPGIRNRHLSSQRHRLAVEVRGPGSNLADHTLLEVTSGGESIIAGSTGNGYRFAELMGATNPSGWSGVLKVKNPAGVTAGYILLYSNPYSKGKPMKLRLDHTQRLNLRALMGAQRADVGSIRAIWALQDKIALDTEEEQVLEIKREVTNGLERVV